MERKNEISRKSFLKGAMSFGAAGALAGLRPIGVLAEEEAREPLYTPGTYTGSASGFRGKVLVEVTFDETHITQVKIDASVDTPTIGGAAVPMLEEQVMKAQGSAIDGVTGATDTSVAVKKAVAQCMYEASGGKIQEGGDIAVREEAPPVPTMDEAPADWLGQAPEISEEEISETLETQILVVGAGNAGLMCGARAAMAGAQVLIIEKAVGSMTERNWIGAVDTKAQKEHGTEIDKNKLVAELCKYASHLCDEKLIRLWVDHSGEVMDWFADLVKSYYPEVSLHHEWDVGNGDFDTYYIPPTMHNFQDNIPEHDYSQETSAYGLPSLTQAVLDHGGQIMYETALVKLVQDEGGRVTGVIAQKADGSYIRILAQKGVALCCGGYPQDQGMLLALNPKVNAVTAASLAPVFDTGDGIKAAMWIGADKDPDATAMLFDRGMLRPEALPNGKWDSPPFHLGSQPWLKVNLEGERFCNERVPYDFIIHAGYLQPGHVYCSIYDSSWMDQIAAFHQFGCARIIPSPSGGKLAIFSPQAEAALLGAMVGAGFIQQADTIEELAQKLHLPVDNFKATVERYNELCEKGVDEDFGKPPHCLLPLKNPPYFGVRQGAQLLCTLDGLRINTKMQVLDKQSSPIEGLYAAGDCSGGFFAHNYPEFIVGVAVGRSFTEGYLLGNQLAEE